MPGRGPAGVFLRFFDKYKVDAIDPLVEDYEKKLALFTKTDYPRVTFHSVTLENYETPKKILNACFCMNAINHVSDINMAFDKLRGFTKNNGYLLITIDAHNNNLFKHLFLSLIPADVLHPHQYNLGRV